MIEPGSRVWEQSWSAPAKLNLCLHILGQRRDGYHELETVFQLVNLCDTLRFTPRDDQEVMRRSGLCEVEPDQDLTVKAARLLQDRAPEYVCGVDIECIKHIPVQAGLGGGSSDAASCLLVLNSLWECGFSMAQLLDLGRELGADVPVFIRGYSAYARGIGEQLTPVNLPERKYLIIKPDVNISTAEIFQDKRLTRDTSAVTIRGLLEPMQVDPQRLTGQNDCENLVRIKYPAIAQLIDFISQFGQARLTGTGSSVFLPIDDKTDIEHIRQELSEQSYAQDCQTYVVRGLNHSPLLDELNNWGVAKW